MSESKSIPLKERVKVGELMIVNRERATVIKISENKLLADLIDDVVTVRMDDGTLKEIIAGEIQQID